MIHLSTEKYYFSNGCTWGMYCMDVKLFDGMFQVCTNMTVTASRMFPCMLWLTRQERKSCWISDNRQRVVVIIADCCRNTVHQALQDRLIHSELLTSYSSSNSAKVVLRMNHQYFGINRKVWTAPIMLRMIAKCQSITILSFICDTFFDKK